MAQQQCHVYACDINLRGLEELKSSLPSSQQEFVTPTVMDISKLESIEQVAQKLPADKLDGLVNNAGILPVDGMTKSLVELSDEHFSRVIGTNLQGTIRVTNAFFPRVKTAKGCIVNVGSIQGYACSPVLGIYPATKGL